MEATKFGNTRAGTISLSHIETGSPVVLTINQDPGGCDLSLVPTSNERDHESNPSTGVINVVTPGSCSWSASSNQTWLTITNEDSDGMTLSGTAW